MTLPPPLQSVMIERWHLTFIMMYLPAGFWDR
jgi:hypothetical protein